MKLKNVGCETFLVIETGYKLQTEIWPIIPYGHTFWIFDGNSGDYYLSIGYEKSWFLALFVIFGPAGA